MKFFIYFSELLDYKVYDSKGMYLGQIHDLSMHITEEIFPRTIGVVVRRGFLFKEYVNVPIEVVEPYYEGKIKLKIKTITFSLNPPVI